MVLLLVLFLVYFSREYLRWGGQLSRESGLQDSNDLSCTNHRRALFFHVLEPHTCSFLTLGRHTYLVTSLAVESLGAWRGRPSGRVCVWAPMILAYWCSTNMRNLHSLFFFFFYAFTRHNDSPLLGLSSTRGSVTRASGCAALTSLC